MTPAMPVLLQPELICERSLGTTETRFFGKITIWQLEYEMIHAGLMCSFRPSENHEILRA